MLMSCHIIQTTSPEHIFSDTVYHIKLFIVCNMAQDLPFALGMGPVISRFWFPSLNSPMTDIKRFRASHIPVRQAEKSLGVVALNVVLGDILFLVYSQKLHMSSTAPFVLLHHHSLSKFCLTFVNITPIW